MAKILLVEDDNNLREIYEARLQAEGYTIVSAHDGEEALVVAKAETPDLIISDVMMPKISGFEMLDILRNTDSLKDVKVIMLTALGQSDDQQRADKLGADRYLVKSQVTLEDIVNVANELLKGAVTDAPAATATASPPATPTTDSTAPQADTPAVSTTSTSSTPVATPVVSTDTTGPSVSPATDSTPPNEPTAVISSDPTPAQPPVPEDQATPTPPAPESSETAVPGGPPLDTTPIPSPDTAKQAAEYDKAESVAESTSEEKSEVDSQIKNFMSSQTSAMPEQTVPSPDAEPVSTTAANDKSDVTPKTDETYSPNPVGKKVIEPLPDTDTKPSINDLLEKEKVIESVENKYSEEHPASTTPDIETAPSAAPEPVVAPPEPAPATTDGIDPNTMAL